MIQVYICEDNEDQMARIKRAVSNTLLMEALDMTLQVCSANPYDILDSVKSLGGMGLYFLDIDLGVDMNGIQLAQNIRAYDPDGFIVFITTHAEMSFLTLQYRLEVLDFILKDDFDQVADRVRETILYAVKKLDKSTTERRAMFKIDDNARTLFIALEDILLFETSPTKHKVIVYTDQRQVEFYSSMKQVEQQLDERFIRCHKSYIVNRDKITEIDRKNKRLRLSNKQTCDASAKALKVLSQ